MRFRLAALSAVACFVFALGFAGEARAAAEVHRLSLVISGIPTQVAGGDFNDLVDRYNAVYLTPKGLENLPHIQFTWAFDAEMRYFVRPSFAIAAGVTQLRATQNKEFLPAIAQSIGVRGEVLTVPVHVGVAYYLQPYNQGDFQARAYVGGGLMQYTYTRATLSQSLNGADSLLTYSFFPGSFREVFTQDSPGYYLEAGGHMFFASRFSIMLGVIVRSGQLREARIETAEINGNPVGYPNPGPVATNTKGQPFMLDVGGVGLKMALGIGF
jgi:hypothetical protein